MWTQVPEKVRWTNLRVIKSVTNLRDIKSVINAPKFVKLNQMYKTELNRRMWDCKSCL